MYETASETFFFFFIWSHKLKSLYLSHPLLVLPARKYALNGEFRWGKVPSPRLNSQEGFYRLCLEHADGRAACILKLDRKQWEGGPCEALVPAVGTDTLGSAA